MGGNEQSTHKYVSELLGKETIDTRTSSQSKGHNGSYSQNFQQTGRELMTPDEVRMLDNKNAIVLIRGEPPIIDQKYDLMKHPNIKLTHSGGAFPYVHSPVCMYSADDLDFTFSALDELEIIDESMEGDTENSDETPGKKAGSTLATESSKVLNPDIIATRRSMPESVNCPPDDTGEPSLETEESI